MPTTIAVDLAKSVFEVAVSDSSADRDRFHLRDLTDDLEILANHGAEAATISRRSLTHCR